MQENFSLLKDSKDAGTLIQHHKQVQTYYSVRNQKIITSMSYVTGEQWTPLQLQKMSRKNKAPVVFDYIKPSYRTVLGMFVNNKYDIEFSPREPNDTNVADVLKSWYSYQAYQNDFPKHDLEALMNSWACGVGYVETYLHTNPGKRPVILSQVLNPLTIYPDPNSRDVGSREDCSFIDRVVWMSKEDLELTFRNKDFSKLSTITNNAYRDTEPHTDIDHENMDTKNNTFKVIERIYKVKIPQYYKFNDNMDKQSVSSDEFKNMPLDQRAEIYNESLEMLYTAIVCPSWSGTEYIYNGEYSCQPRNPRTLKIIFPIQEIPAESINGRINGFVEHLISPQNLINAAMTQLYHQMQHGVGASFAIDKSKFSSEDEAKRFAKEHTNADEVFNLKEDVNINNAIQVIPRSNGINTENNVILNNALNAFREISSTPLSLQGITENSSTSGVLNEQRITQATTQLLGITSNYKGYLRRRADLMLAYLFEYKDQFADEVVRILEKSDDPNAPKYVTMMETSPELDANGEWTGALTRLQDPTTFDYDIDVTDSFYSPSQREKVQQKLVQIIQMGATNNDPVMNSFLIIEFLKSLDIPQSVKQNIISHASALQQQQGQEQQGQAQQQQLDQQSQLIDNMGKTGLIGNQTPPTPIPPPGA